MTLRARLTALAAILAMLAILAGLPAILLAIDANPIPEQLPTLDQIRTTLTSPDDGTLALYLITVAAWAAWIVLAVSIVLEIAAQVRGVVAPGLPGLGIPQHSARQLVTAAALLFTAIPTAAAIAPPAHATIAQSAPPSHTGADTAMPAYPGVPVAESRIDTGRVTETPTGGAARTRADRPDTEVDGLARDDATRTYTVQADDSLSTIAARELGDGNRWPELAAANAHVAGNPDLIHPGTILEIPTRAADTGGARPYVVKAGDTLSAIAKTELGDPDRYGEIFEASRHTRQPDGRYITDPDQIDIGQRLTIPTTASPDPAGRNGIAVAPSADQEADSLGEGTYVAPLAERRAAAPSEGGTIARSDAVPDIPAPTGSPVPASASARTVDSETGAPVSESMSIAPWTLAGLTGGGALLAGALLFRLRRIRSEQDRHRRPGRTLASPDPVLLPVEKTIATIGEVTAPTAEHLDTVLRRLAAAQSAAEAPMPDLASVELTAEAITLHLRAPSASPAPWTENPDQLWWSIPASTQPDQIGPHVPDQPAPYPLLATIGLDDQGHTWLLNLEDATVTITGDTDYAGDYARHLALEAACTPWSSLVQIDCFGIATELAPISFDMLQIHEHPIAHDDPATDPIVQALAEAICNRDAADIFDTGVPTARAHQIGADAWPARLLLLGATAAATSQVRDLVDFVTRHPGRTGSAIVADSGTDGARHAVASGVTLEFTPEGRVLLPERGLDLIAVGLTEGEAAGCATLLAHHNNPIDAPTPRDEDATDGWLQWADHAGALRAEQTISRHPDTRDAADASIDESLNGTGNHENETIAPAGRPDGEVGATSMLDQPDEAYTAVAATTPQDLDTLAPRVPATVRDRVEDTDPTLDDDVTLWFSDDCPLPRLRLLGPVRATTRGEPLTKRRPYMTELLTYLALRPNGATVAEVTDTFAITGGKAREYTRTIRKWLGTNPRTGQPHLPDARSAPSKVSRGAPVYEVIDILIDVDIFRRLRVRGQARGADGIDDLITALRLVDGSPFDYPPEREDSGGWSWLIDGDRIDQHIKTAIIDVAHIITTHALATGDTSTARMAAETAALAVSSEEIPHLDLAAVATAEGNHAEASRIIRDQISNRTDDDLPPPDIPDRTAQILRQQHNRRRAS